MAAGERVNGCSVSSWEQIFKGNSQIVSKYERVSKLKEKSNTGTPIYTIYASKSRSFRLCKNEHKWFVNQCILAIRWLVQKFITSITIKMSSHHYHSWFHWILQDKCIHKSYQDQYKSLHSCRGWGCTHQYLKLRNQILLSSTNKNTSSRLLLLL